MNKRKLFILFILVIFAVSSVTASLLLRYDRYYNYQQVIDAIEKLKNKHSKFIKVSEIGKSIQGRKLVVVTLNNPKTGPAESKPGMYMDANIHGNEIQGTEVTLYLIDYLLSNYGNNEKITNLMDRVCFYIIPMINPDGRAFFLDKPNNPNSSRYNKRPIDDDNDGIFDEDDYDDLDKDGNIVMMRKKVEPGTGNFKLDKNDKRIMRRVKRGEKGDYILLGMEGIDNDNDGRINEDPLGGIDLNRTYGFNWMPRFIQHGTSDYPFQDPETRAIADFLVSHPNIGATQDFHNSGGMILRGPGAKNKGRYPFKDVKIYDYIGEKGEKLLPGYRYLISWKDLYTVYGGFNDFSYKTLGIISFTNELYFSYQDFDKDGDVTEEERMKWNDELLHGNGFVEWHEYNHPTYGKVEIGGWRKLTSRVPPGFQLQDLCHRNASFMILNAFHLPKVKIKKIETEKIKNNIYRVRVLVMNERMISTKTQQAVMAKIGSPDYIFIQGENIKVISGGIETNSLLKKYSPQKINPGKIKVSSLDGMQAKYFQWIVKGNGKISIIYNSEKGGKIAKETEL